MSESRGGAYFSLFSTSLGACGVAWRGDALIATHLPEDDPDVTRRHLAARAGATEGEPPEAVGQAIASITALLEGESADLSAIACAFEGLDPFEVRVYRATRAIPAGSTSTYGAIASQLGNAHLARHVGRALGRNPLPIVVPCHRVIGANGKLTGFSAPGGLATKRKMLAIEGVCFGDQYDLFDGLAP